MNNFVYAFDSHSIRNGWSVLLTFRNVFEIENYIQIAYLEFTDKQQLYFHKTEAINTLSIFCKYKNSIRRINYQSNSTIICKRNSEIYYEKIGTLLHDKLKAKKRFHYEKVCVREKKRPAQVYATKQGKRKVKEIFLHTNLNSHIAAHFKTQIKEGP